MRYCVDTNVISDILNHRKDVKARFDKELDSGNEIAASPIVYYEIVRGLRAIGATKKLQNFFRIYNKLPQLPLDIGAMEKAANIYVELRKGQQIDDNDIYIAAVAMVNNCTLVTANEKHFGRISDLQIINWRDI